MPSAQVFYRYEVLDDAVDFAANYPNYRAKIYIRAAGVTRSAKYEVTDDYQYASLVGFHFPDWYRSERGQSKTASRDTELFFPHAEFYDVVVSE